MKKLVLFLMLLCFYSSGALATDTTEHANLTGSDLHVGAFSGSDANKSTITPRVGDRYDATDTNKTYRCYLAGTWTEDVAGTNPQDSSNLVAIKNATTPAYKIDVDADNLSVGETNLTSVNLTIDITASGANGLDTGSESSSTDYDIHVIYDEDTTTTAGLLTERGNSPTLPSGYDYSRLVGRVYNDSSGDFETVRNTERESINTYMAADVPAGKIQEGFYFLLDTGVMGYYYDGGWSEFSGVPVGTVVAYGSETEPTNWYECSGDSLVEADYPELYAVIGDNFGSPDATHFNLPNLKGRFIRGWDNGAGNDPLAGSRAVSASGGQSGDNVGSYQDDANDPHTHTIAGSFTELAGGSGNVFRGSGSINTGSQGSGDAHPKNVYFMYIIKYQ